MIRIYMLIAVVQAGCSKPDSTVAGTFTTGLSVAAAPRILHGASWIDPSSPDAISVRDDGTFEVPASSRAVSAFVDLNSDGVLQVGTEPSTPCELLDQGWSCSLARASVRLHQRSRVVDAEKLHTRFVSADAYDADTGAQTQDIVVCSGARCSEAQVAGFADASPGTQTLPICGWEGSVGEGVEVSIRDRVAGTSEVAFSALDEDVRYVTQSHERGTTFVFESSQPLDRAVAWIGRIEDDELREVQWHSELSGAGVMTSGGGFSVEVPAAKFEANAKLVVQLVRIEYLSDSVRQYVSAEFIFDAEALP